MVEIVRDTLTPMIKMLLSRLDEDVNKPTTDDVGEMVIEENVARIAERKTPQGKAQTENQPSTIKRKGHNVALRGKDHILEDGSLYKKLRTSPTRVLLFLPIEREAIVGYLKKPAKYKKTLKKRGSYRITASRTREAYHYWEIPNKIRGMKPDNFMRARWVHHFNRLKGKANG